jgi:hypothetical protein
MENAQWQAKWIWSDRPRAHTTHELVYFRRQFEVANPKRSRLAVRVTADSRYRLYLNGESVSVGPCKGDGWTHYYETVDLSPSLRQGMNVLAAKVLYFSNSVPLLQKRIRPDSIWSSDRPGFLLDGVLADEEGRTVECLHTDRNWRCCQDESLTFVPATMTPHVGGTEKVDGAQKPHHWTGVDFNDSAWPDAVPFSEVADLQYGQLTPWILTPRPIPPLFERQRWFVRVIRAEGDVPVNGDQFAQANPEPVRLKAGSRVVVELDAGELTTGYLALAVSGGKGSNVRIRCSECYEEPTSTPGNRRKGIRDQHEGRVLLGDTDSYAVAGAGRSVRERWETYEPFWFRTFRFVRLEIEVADEPLLIHRFDYRETGYPLDIQGSFRCSDPTFSTLWSISIRTLQRCMHETYEDCPYYEQLQYGQDTQLQILYTYHTSSDDRLARRAIFDFHSSLMPNGMLLSRHPSARPQVIPGFSFFWIFMVHDHYLYYGDARLVRRYISTVDAVLGWFDRLLTPDGLVGPAPSEYWSFVDWTEQWKHLTGVPPAAQKGPVTVYSLYYAVALQRAADLHDAAQRPDTAREYRQRAEDVLRAVQRHCWSKPRELYKDGPGVDEYSQHAQVWSVLAGLTGAESAAGLMARTLDSVDLTKVSYSMSFYLFRALSRAGLYDRAFALWDTWRALADLHLTTWLEDPISQRSDCHGWGSIPLYEFTAEILGVKPAEPGYSRIRIKPQRGPLKWAEGIVSTSRGNVSVRWKTDDEDRFEIRVDGIPGIPLDMVMPNGHVVEFYDSAYCTASCSLQTLNRSTGHDAE